MQEMRILKFYLNKSHPDSKIAKHHSEQARILYNGMNALVRESQRFYRCLLYTSPSPRDRQKSRMPSSA